jgi:PIN domain nuclease of toxin-antitoxin system
LRDLERAIPAAGFQVLDVTIQHAAATHEINLEHNDPFDRLLLAQCEVETLRLVTADQMLAGIPSVIAV